MGKEIATPAQFDPDAFMSQRAAPAFDPDKFMQLRDRSVPGYQRLENAGMVAHAPEQPGALEQIGTSLKNQAGGLLDMLGVLTDPTGKKTAEIGDQMAAHSSRNWQEAKDAYAKGDYKGAVAALGRSIPIIGGMIDKTSSDIVDGRGVEAATDLLAIPLLTKGAGMIEDAATNTATGVGLRAGVNAGAPKVAVGVAKAAGGAGADLLAHQIGLPPQATGSLFGLFKGSKDIGEGIRIGREAGKTAADNFRRLQEEARIASLPPRPSPLWAKPVVEPPAAPVPEVPKPTQFPSGRKPGGIQNQFERAAPAAEAASRNLDSIAADLGYKKPYIKLTAAQQAEVKIAVRAAEQESARAAAPPPAPSNILDTPAKQQAAQALADELNQVSTPQITSKGVNLFDREKPGMPKDVRPVPHDDLHNAVIDPKDVNLFARDYGMTEPEALKFMEDKGVLVLDRAQSNKGIHDYYGTHENASNAALRKFGVKSMKDLTDSQVASWYNELLENQTTKADNQLIKAQRATAKKGTK